MSFMSRLKDAEAHLSEYEPLAQEIASVALDGLTKLQAHRDAVKTAVAGALGMAEQFAALVASATTAATGSTAVQDSQTQFLGKSG